MHSAVIPGMYFSLCVGSDEVKVPIIMYSITLRNITFLSILHLGILQTHAYWSLLFSFLFLEKSYPPLPLYIISISKQPDLLSISWSITHDHTTPKVILFETFGSTLCVSFFTLLTSIVYSGILFRATVFLLSDMWRHSYRQRLCRYRGYAQILSVWWNLKVLEENTFF